MDFDIELELHRRPDADSAVGLAATRLKICLKSDRNAITHDHRPGESCRHPVQTIAPDGAPQWATNTEHLWNRIEWTERAGTAPVLFEARVPVPSALTNEEALRFGAAVAGFVAEDLRVPVSVVSVESLEAALWCVMTTNNFRDAVLAAANLGDDADTTAAITGQVAGAVYGIDGIPGAWKAALARGAMIGDIATRLHAERLQMVSGAPEGS
jgi:hypothetical protein